MIEPVPVDYEDVMDLFRRLYPTELAHVMATIEAAHWRRMALALQDDQEEEEQDG